MAKIMNKKIAKHILGELDSGRNVLAVENHPVGSKQDLTDQIELLDQSGYIRAKLIKNYRKVNGGYALANAEEITHAGRIFYATL